MSSWVYTQPVKIYFGVNQLNNLPEITSSIGGKKGILVCDHVMVSLGTAARVLEISGGTINMIFSDIQPNPTVTNVDNCAQAVRDSGADYIVALGGGSVMDCAKAAAAVATGDDSIEKYHATGESIVGKVLPIIAIPTTSGTGSEVTAVSVVTNEEKGFKAPIVSESFYPKVAIIDPTLTYSVPSKITAITGLDALSHALEGFTSIGHQPVTDALALASARIIFSNIEAACSQHQDKDARNNMAEASVVAGLTFNLPKTNAGHACSFVLTNKYGIPHGEACILTLDYFLRLYKKEARLQRLASDLNFASVDSMCDEIARLKSYLGQRTDLKDFNLSSADIDHLVEKSHHPNLKNAPVEITNDMLYNLYNGLK